MTQLGLFGTVPAEPPDPPRQPPPRRVRTPRRSSSAPEAATDVLAEAAAGLYGLLDDTDRIVVFEEHGRVRLAADEDIVVALIHSGYLEQHPRRDTVAAFHGAIRRPVTPLRPTARGRDLLSRWTALCHYRKDRS